MPTPPPISTILGASVPRKLNFPYGPEAGSRSPALTRSCRNPETVPYGACLTVISHQLRQHGEEAIEYERFASLPSIVTETVRNWPGAKIKGRSPSVGCIMRNVRTSAVSWKMLATRSCPDQRPAGSVAGAAALCVVGAAVDTGGCVSAAATGAARATVVGGLAAGIAEMACLLEVRCCSNAPARFIL